MRVRRNLISGRKTVQIRNMNVKLYYLDNAVLYKTYLPHPEKLPERFCKQGRIGIGFLSCSNDLKYTMLDLFVLRRPDLKDSDIFLLNAEREIESCEDRSRPKKKMLGIEDHILEQEKYLRRRFLPFETQPIWEDEDFKRYIEAPVYIENEYIKPGCRETLGSVKNTIRPYGGLHREVKPIE